MSTASTKDRINSLQSTRSFSASTKLKTMKSMKLIQKSSSINNKKSSKDQQLNLNDAQRFVKLRPENGLMGSSGKYDCCAFVIHCPVHNRILINHQDHVVWMPFISLLHNLGWEDNAILGFIIIISGGDPDRVNTFKEHPPYEHFMCMQVLRLQMPRTMRFITRLIYYFRIKCSSSGHSYSQFQCGQNTDNLEWVSVNEITKYHNFWGPELLEFVNNLNAIKETRITEYSMEEVFLYVPRDPPRNLEEEMLKPIHITEKDVERLYEDFLVHCYPSFAMSIESFKCYMKKREFEKNDSRLHGKFRVKFIYRFFSDDSGIMNRECLRRALLEINSDPNTIDTRIKQAMTCMNVKEASNGDFIITERDFVSAIGNLRFRGTSVLCRYQKGIFSQISRALVAKGLRRAEKALSNVLIKRRYSGLCKPCKDKKYDLATHSVKFDSHGNLKIKRIISKYQEDSAISQNNHRKEHLTAQQYSIETVFNRNSAANIIINLVRDFSNNKGTVRNPNGLMQDRKEDLWKLLLSINGELELLLKNEYKCHKIYSPCFIMGDIHGNIEDLFSLEKALWKQIPCIGANYLFLGDYVDRGQWGFECAMYLFAFKILCPNKVTLLRGNHEVRLIQSNYTYKRECINKYGDIFGLKIWELTNRIFDKLPVCALVDDCIFCAHGGLPRSATEIEQLIKIKQELKDPERESRAAWEILWSDPCHMQQYLEVADLLNLNPDNLNGFIKNTKRGTAFLFNENGATNFLRKNGLTHIIRAHEVPPNGYTFHFGNKCVTIFSCSHYCGNDNDCACILADTQKLRVIQLDTVNNSSATD
ncbi:hypothetical protein DERP_011053 [Dermatophagoides pteronyssinus]|uniref:Serine/threonine-protein phosphatase n=1 Tax=Dermatophagoides pteronyssinus TaxID=6956 RepID=A0ABQ8J992_DERPT|nr:hypothetical protein DERP_011053 [Dermatophagoides pteronyssinus]